LRSKEATEARNNKGGSHPTAALEQLWDSTILSNGEAIACGEQDGEIVAHRDFGNCGAGVGGGLIAQRIITGVDSKETIVEGEHEGEVLVLIACTDDEIGIKSVLMVEHGIVLDLVVPIALGVAFGELVVVHGAEKTIANSRSYLEQAVMTWLTDGQLILELHKDGQLEVEGAIGAVANGIDGLYHLLEFGTTADKVEPYLEGEILSKECL